MKTIIPFTQESLNLLFKTSIIYPDMIAIRESSRIEFKESFNWGSRETYARTLAAFANTKGGYIIYGIVNTTKKLVGLKNDNFEKIDPGIISGFLNDAFSPEIKWYMLWHKFQEKYFGLLYVEESFEKPLIARKNIGNEIKEGEIYYRYRGRTEKIKYPELRKIIDDQQLKERNYWIKTFRKMAKVGVKNIGLFDFTSGKVTGSGGSFLIDKSLLDKIKFIKEGEFHESKGSPTLKLMGDLRPIESGLIKPSKIVYKAIGTPDIVYSFLNKEKVGSPIEYIKRICFESSGYLPIYYFMKFGNYSKKQILEHINNIPSMSQSKKTIIKRLSSDEQLFISFPAIITDSAEKKRKYRDQIINKTVDNEVPMDERRYFLQSIRTLKKTEIDEDYLLPILKDWFDRFYVDKEANLADDLRRSICYVDLVLNKQNIK